MAWSLLLQMFLLPLVTGVQYLLCHHGLHALHRVELQDCARVDHKAEEGSVGVGRSLMDNRCPPGTGWGWQPGGHWRQLVSQSNKRGGADPFLFQFIETQGQFLLLKIQWRKFDKNLKRTKDNYEWVLFLFCFFLPLLRQNISKFQLQTLILKDAT